MKGKYYPNVEVFWTDKLEGNHLLLTGPKKKQNGEESFIIFMFIANNSIFKSIIYHIIIFLARSISLKQCHLMMNFEKNSFYSFQKICKNTNLMVKPLQNVTF